jgi:hypothetical protein
MKKKKKKLVCDWTWTTSGTLALPYPKKDMGTVTGWCTVLACPWEEGEDGACTTLQKGAVSTKWGIRKSILEPSLVLQPCEFQPLPLAAAAAADLVVACTTQQLLP